MVLGRLIVCLENHNHYTIAYADDVVILQTGKFESSLCERMQAALRIHTFIHTLSLTAGRLKWSFSQER